MIRVVIPGVPVAQPRQRHRVVTVGDRSFAQNYTPQDSPVTAFKAAVRIAAGSARQGEPLAGPLRCDMTFVLPRPKALTKKRGDNPRAWAPKKPDVDNLFKSVADALNGQLWADDSQIVSASIRKVFAAADEQPQTIVEVVEL